MTCATANPALPTRADALHRRLMTSAAVAASLTALALSPAARAQGVAGTGVVNSGTASISSPNASTTQVNTTSQQTIITWSPTDTAPTGGPINFLPDGNTWNFIGTTPGYTVLNRFLTTGLPINRQIALNGTINSFQNVAGINVVGGNIWFYNAGGILVGSTGAINVGSLVLTANDIDTPGNELFGVDGNIRFRGVNGSTSTVQIDAGAAITVANTNPGGAYLALVAPRIVQRGFVSTDGSTAYVAAEQADIRINQGLFDINVLVGAAGGTVIDHSGITTGPSAAQGDPNDSRIYMVAIPKNDAVTMLVSGQVGYQEPVTAQIDPNGAIRLSAGYDIVNGEIAALPNPVSTADANIGVRDIIFNSDTIARASNDFIGAPVAIIPAFNPSFLPPPQLGRIVTNGTALFQGDDVARLSIGNQQQILANAGLTLRAGGTIGQPGLAEILLTYNAAAAGNRPGLGVTGQLVVDASRGAFDSSGQASGGTARINNNGGLISASDMFIDARGTGEFAGSSTAGDGQGGTAELLISGAGAVTQAVSLLVTAAGEGGGDRLNVNLGVTEVADAGGAGNGGNARVAVSGGAALSVLQAFNIDASGSGGTGSGTAGAGFGGQARLNITGGTSSVTTPFVNLDASGTGGSPVAAGPSISTSVSRGGDAFGGIAEISSSGAANLGAVSLDAGGRGGVANSGTNSGGSATGGTATLITTGAATTLSQLDLDASGIAGAGTDGLPGDVGGTGTGGTVDVQASGGSITVAGNVTADAQANTLAGAADFTQARSGGSIQFRATNGGSISATGGLIADASGGFDSGAGVANGSSQNASGGSIILEGANGTVSFGSLTLNADGLTADGSISNGDAAGGTITLAASNNGVVETTNVSGINSISASGFAGSGPVGGAGTGGTVNLIADGGRITLTNFTSVDVSGTSGTSDTATPSNPGSGGTILIRTGFTATSQLALGTFFADATGRNGRLDEGGLQAGGLSAGNGVGGSILFEAFGGTISGDTVAVLADGEGGSSRGGTGGTGTGGNATITFGGGDLIFNSFTASASGRGGRGSEIGSSGNGVGGTVIMTIDAGNVTVGTLSAEAFGIGGDGSFGRDETPDGGTVRNGGEAGTGSGGTAILNVNAGATNIGTLTLNAGGTGGDGGDFGEDGGALGDTGTGGAGIGGDAELVYSGGQLLADFIGIAATGTGGDAGDLLFNVEFMGSASDIATGGTGGSGSGGSASLAFNTDFDPGGNILLDASATGGLGAGGFNGPSGNGGDATAGGVFITANGGNTTLTGMVLRADATAGNGRTGLISSGLGGPGSSQGGAGGAAMGGAIRIETIGVGTTLLVDNADIRANAVGGEGGNSRGNVTAAARGGSGGNGTGGIVSFIASDASELTLVAPQGLSATGQGGEGGNGSTGGTGASVSAPAANGANGAGGGVVGAAGGNGGSGADGIGGGGGGTGGEGGEGGAGNGGTINLIAQSGGLLINQIVSFDVQGFGGAGGRGGQGGTGGAGQGGGNGGDGGTGVAPGLGGNGGNGGRGGNGGSGGNGGIGSIGGIGTGGNVLLSTSDANIASGDLLVSAGGLAGATGAEGAAGIGGAAGEGGSGGLGGVSAAGNGADGIAGANGAEGPLGGVGDFNFALERGQGGTISFATSGESGGIQAGFVELISSALDNFGNPFGSGGTIGFDVASFSGSSPAISLLSLLAESLGSDSASGRFAIDIDAGSSTIEIAGPMELRSVDGVRIAADNGGSLAVGGDALIVSDTDIAFDMAGSGQLAAGGSVTVEAQNDILLTHIENSGGSTVQAGGNIGFFASQNILGDEGSVVSANGGSADFGANGLVTLIAANAADNLSIIASAVNLGQGSAGSSIFILAAAATNVSNGLTAGQDISVGGGGTIDIFNAEAGDDILLDGSTMVLGDLRATGDGFDNDGDGANFTISSTGNVAIDHAEADGNLTATVAGDFTTGLASIITGGDIVIAAGDSINLGNSTAGGVIDVTGSQIDFNALDAGGEIALTTLAGTISAAGPPVGNGNITGLSAFSDNAITLNSRANVDVRSVRSGVESSITAAGGVSLGRIVAGGNATITAGTSITINQGVQTPLANTVGGNLTMTAPTLTFEPLQVSGNAILDAVNDLNGILDVGGTTNLDADNGLVQVTIRSGGPITASANVINLTGATTGTMNIAQLTTDVGGATINSTRDIVIQSATLAGNSRIATTGGILTVNQASVSAGSLDLIADENITLGQISASNNLDIEAGERLVVNAVLSAANIQAESGDIAIGANGRIGVLGTTQSVFVANNDANAPTFIGGTGSRSGWHLDAAEATQLFGNNITVRGIRVQTVVSTSIGSSRPPDVTVDDFTINATQQFGANGTFQVETTGKLRVLGDVRFTSAGDGQQVLVRGEDALEVILGTGSIYVTGSAPDQLAGILNLESDDIVVATAQAISDISALTDTAAIDARLAQNDGITNDIGALAANRIILDHDAPDSVYIQNSGTGTAFDQRRGISFGAGGLFVNGPGPLDNFVINAVQRTAGGVVTGLAVIPLVTVNGPVSASPTGTPTAAAAPLRFNPLSTINGCPLGNISSCGATPPPTNEPESLFPVQDVIEEEVDDDGEGREGEGDEGTGDSSVISPLITLRGLDPLTGEPLIDDPVTGAGNEDLWVPDE